MLPVAGNRTDYLAICPDSPPGIKTFLNHDIHADYVFILFPYFQRIIWGIPLLPLRIYFPINHFPEGWQVIRRNWFYSYLLAFYHTGLLIHLMEFFHVFLSLITNP